MPLRRPIRLHVAFGDDVGSNEYWFAVTQPPRARISYGANLNGRTPTRKTAASVRPRGASTLRLSKYPADAAHTSAAITHQLGGRHKYFPAHSPPANDNAAQNKGCREGVRFLKIGGLTELKRDGGPALL